jgi:hypothetical protein
MRSLSRRRAAACLLAMAVLAGCSDARLATYRRPVPMDARAGYSVTYDTEATAGRAEGRFDVSQLVKPRRKYLGAWLPDVPKTTGPIAEWNKAVGKKANILGFYSAFGDRLERDRLENAWKAGAVPMISWEPYEAELADIAAGRHDEYLIEYASALAATDIPTALVFAHEMNGWWFPWNKEAAEDYVAAFRHVHTVFNRLGATTVIWVWSPNIDLEVPRMKPMASYWPGDSFVDWVAPIGYYVWSGGRSTFDDLFTPTFEQVRKLTAKPVILAETAVPEAPEKPAHIAELFAEVASRKSIVGIVWFNYDKERDWRVESSAASLTAFREAASRKVFGFDPRRP